MAVNFAGGLAPPAESNVLQTFEDATAGRSLFLYYGVAMTVSGGTTYALTRDGGFSNPSVEGTTATYTFDITINKTTLFAGIGYMDVHIGRTVDAAVSTIVATVYHYDGSTETSLGTATSANLTGVTDHLLKLPLTITKKAFKPGDTLRLKCIFTEGAGSSAQFYHDPNTAGDELKLWMPVVNLE